MALLDHSSFEVKKHKVVMCFKACMQRKVNIK